MRPERDGARDLGQSSKALRQRVMLNSFQLHSFRDSTIISKIFRAGFSPVCRLFGDDPIYKDNQTHHKNKHAANRHGDDVQWIDMRQILLELRVFPDSQKRPGNCFDTAQERRCRPGVTHAGPPASSGFTPLAVGAGGVLLPTSKKVYDSVMVFTSLDNLPSTINATGHCFFSPGSSVY